MAILATTHTKYSIALDFLSKLSTMDLQSTTIPVTTTIRDSTMMIAADQSPQIAIDSLHMDYIHRVAFDTYGRRMATCSGDRFVRVWDLTDSGEWNLTAQWQAHRGSVTSLCWAHPEYGSLIATSGSDHEAKIWEERSNTAGLAVRWNLKASLTDPKRSVTCLEFAPRHWGLKLAVGSADGCVRIYEAVDIMNLAQWPMAAQLQSFAESSKLGVTSLCWCTGRFEAPTLVVGGSHLVIYRYSESSRAWQPLLQFPAPDKGDVLDVAWAPNCGRRFHYIASAEGQQMRIYKLSRDSEVDGGEKQLVLQSTQVIPVNAWRVQFNVTGTVLASSGDGGVVQLYKANLEGQFQCVSKIQGVTESK